MISVIYIIWTRLIVTILTDCQDKAITLSWTHDKCNAVMLCPLKANPKFNGHIKKRQINIQTKGKLMLSQFCFYWLGKWRMFRLMHCSDDFVTSQDCLVKPWQCIVNVRVSVWLVSPWLCNVNVRVSVWLGSPCQCIVNVRVKFMVSQSMIVYG